MEGPFHCGYLGFCIEFYVKVGPKSQLLFLATQCPVYFRSIVTQDLSKPIALRTFSLFNFSGCLIFRIRVFSGTGSVIVN